MRPWELSEALFGAPQEAHRDHFGSIFKRIIKPFYYLSLAICSGFLILLSKENLNYRLNKSYIFLVGTSILILSELTTSLSGKDLFYFKVSLFLPLVLIVIQYLYFKKKLRFN